MLGALKRFLPDEGLLNAAIRGGSSMAKKDIEGVTTLLIDAEMKMFEGLRTPVVFLQNVVVDLLLGPRLQRRLPDLRRPRARALRRRAGLHHDEPPGAAAGARGRRASRTRSCARTSTRSASACPAGSRPTRRTLREHRFRAIAMSVFASGAIPADGGDRVGLRAAEPGVDRVRRLERAQHPADPRPRGPALGPRAGAQLTTLLVASTGGHLKQLHRLHRRLDGIEGPFRWATFDTPQSRSLLAGEDVDFVHFVGGRDPGNVLRNVPLVHRHPARRTTSTRSSAPARPWRCRSTPSAAPAGWSCTTSRAPRAATARRRPQA